jgi:hypothetical protein
MDVEVKRLSDWQIAALGSQRVIVFRPRPDPGDGPGRTAGSCYVMTPAQCLSLICELTAAVHDLENAVPAARDRTSNGASRSEGRNPHRAGSRSASPVF